MSYFFTSESVSEGHPDKIADQISDTILDQFLAFDKKARIAIETLVAKGQIILIGEVNSNISIDIDQIIRKLIKDIGYDKNEYGFNYKSCGIIYSLNKQSKDIIKAIEKKNKSNAAGDQGIIFGYAKKETENYMPLTLELCNILLKEIAIIRKEKKVMQYLRPDAKSQVTIEYDSKNIPCNIDNIVLSIQHDNFDNESNMHKQIFYDVKNIVIPRIIEKLPEKYISLFKNNKIKYFINPGGKFVIGGPDGDSGLTGRKIIADTYGGRGSHGGGAFSGKDPSKMDRSAAYAARHIAKNIVASGIADEILIQISYVIGISDPISIYVNSYKTSKYGLSDYNIAEKIKNIFELKPNVIEKTLKLRNPIYRETATYGHMGRTPKKIKKIFKNYESHIEKNVELFTWEKLNLVKLIKSKFI